MRVKSQARKQVAPAPGFKRPRGATVFKTEPKEEAAGPQHRRATDPLWTPRAALCASCCACAPPAPRRGGAAGDPQVPAAGQGRDTPPHPQGALLAVCARAAGEARRGIPLERAGRDRFAGGAEAYLVGLFEDTQVGAGRAPAVRAASWVLR
ncbi:hypothetical protein ABPG77_010912 [Micractinium sp. CCAP 211/92]